MYRLTDSNFYSAATNRVELCSKLNSMFYSKFSLSVKDGRHYKPHVRNLYLQAMNEKGFEGILVEDVGLLISRKNSFLGASLDDKYNSTLSSALSDKKFFLKNMTP